MLGPAELKKILYLDFKVITLTRSDCSNAEPPSVGRPKELLEDARAVTEPPMLVADEQRSPRELCWLATSPGWHSSVQDPTPPDLLAFPQRSLGATEWATLPSLSTDLHFPHLCEGRHADPEPCSSQLGHISLQS